MSKAGPLLIVAGIACAGLALAISWEQPGTAVPGTAVPGTAAPGTVVPGATVGTAVLSSSHPEPAAPAASPTATADGAGRNSAVSGGWRTWSQATLGQATGPTHDPKPVTVTVTLPHRSSAPAQTSANLAAAPHDRGSLVRALQHGLKRVGCYHGQITGEWTRESRKAMQALTVRLNAELPVETPDDVLLALVEGQPDNACNAGCRAGESLAGDGRCLPSALVAKNLPTPTPPPVTVSERAAPPASGSSWATTTTGWTGAAPAASAEATLPEGRMALAGPKPAMPPLAQAAPAASPKGSSPAGGHAGFGPGFFRQLDRFGNN